MYLGRNIFKILVTQVWYKTFWNSRVVLGEFPICWSNCLLMQLYLYHWCQPTRLSYSTTIVYSPILIFCSFILFGMAWLSTHIFDIARHKIGQQSHVSYMQQACLIVVVTFKPCFTKLGPVCAPAKKWVQTFNITWNVVSCWLFL